jgi:hypothetical protein
MSPPRPVRNVKSSSNLFFRSKLSGSNVGLSASVESLPARQKPTSRRLSSPSGRLRHSSQPRRAQNARRVAERATWGHRVPPDSSACDKKWHSERRPMRTLGLARIRGPELTLTACAVSAGPSFVGSADIPAERVARTLLPRGRVAASRAVNRTVNRQCSETLEQPGECPLERGCCWSRLSR